MYLQELFYPVTEVGKWLLSMAYWEDSLKSFVFCLVFTYIIFSEGSVDELKVEAPPAMNKVEQLLAVQNAISQAEEFIQDGNIVLLKFRALLLSIFPQASEIAVALLAVSLFVAFVPSKYIILFSFWRHLRGTRL
ncbi:hypothetical protein LOK49_LG14G00217 [Camellia lanceoleosa]|uniref:Uncharacterized protein n=1 Tax=Camellia lanceoleosa TaxID=1840588 RepID=A0ACC0F830_9ERIC|nr:hypothetical protein LOK49_LG14G00217 [Camellia lanceoleosa]